MLLGLETIILLFLWVVITFAAVLRSLMKHKTIAKKIFFAFVSFMLTMGWLLAYWRIEYLYLKNRLDELCRTQGGTFIYISPQEWRKQIGEEEWQLLKYSTEFLALENRSDFIYENEIYYEDSQPNQRLSIYESKENIIKNIFFRNLDVFSQIYVDSQTNQVLAKRVFFNVNKICSKNISGLGCWLSDVSSCKYHLSNHKELERLEKAYSNIKEEK